MDYPRSVRVAETLRREISSIALSELKDPRIGMVSMTRVDLTPDLRNSRVYVSYLGDAADGPKAIEGLQRAAGYIRRLLGKRLDLRRIPELTFILDKGAEYSIDIEEKLEHLDEDMDV